MAFKGLRQRQVVARGAGWGFNPPPRRAGAPPRGAPPRDRSPAPAGEIRLACDGQPYAFQPGHVVRIGRASDNDVVVSDPAVSRKHAQLTWAAEGWVFET